MAEKILISWSGGKDSALALHELLQPKMFEIAALVTTVTEDFDRISMHGVRRVLLEQQAASLHLPLEIVWIPKDASNQEYEIRMQALLEKYLRVGISKVAFGDIYLEDLRKYREDNLAKLEMQALFPLWKRNTTVMARDFIQRGFRAVITCVDSQALDGHFVGREFDSQFLSDLPAAVDPCGENGEFHSFVHDGPLFQEPIRHERGQVTFRDERFFYCDLLPATLS